ncbi:50S ribosomal protein L21 [Phenylobacterium sp.]|uniref:50S ribosomal protein L21 n=1 Tax=Phenylobacterium sp. TaxID=1871053 RepID=UPI0027307524|nr:50S ribosomal protein L21 [Phenylobacterium sp.]MDP1618944.1 50S ribosomal protein L21 [Phenylobacterium sp.]MDP1987672.1 50S ribosomal protein L21 [Phenylobacterium sp.]
MYAVIKTGGKQYRVQPGDLLVVEKLDGEPGADVAFGDVLMLGDGDTVTLGAPLVDGATVSATLIETRKGEKVKIFKKIRRQGYRRTRGHRQIESVLRVTSIAGVGKTDKWDGEVDLTTKAVLNARARGLAPRVEVEDKPAKAAPKKAEAAPVEAEADAPKAEAKKAAPKKAAAPKAEAGEKKAAPKKAAAKKESDAE